ncbi:MAG: M48 family metallopeptidase [Chloroflexi bacterium]|nr:M48 family metallopeptidase [Chloroflexota bacterium]
MPVNIDPDRQRQAREYARRRQRLLLLELVLGGLYLLAWLLSGVSTGLKGLLLQVTSLPPLLVALYAAVFGAGYELLLAPLSFYGGYVLPRRYGLSTQNRRAWLGDQLKAAALGGVLGLAVLEVVYALLATFPGTWWLWAAVFLILGTVVLANLSPVLIVPLFYKFTPLEDSELARRLAALAERAGTRVRGVFTINLSSKTTAANAALMGWGNTRRIVLGDTLLAHYTPDEIETVLAHELAHHVHGDIWQLMAVQSLLLLGGLFLADRFLAWGVAHFAFQGPADVAAMPLLALALALFGLVTMPLANAYSRWRESAADDYALRATGKAEAFHSAMTRLANQNLAELAPAGWNCSCTIIRPLASGWPAPRVSGVSGQPRPRSSKEDKACHQS